MTGVKTDSAATDCGDNFQVIAILQHARPKLAARNDFGIALDGDAFSRQPQRVDQIRAGRGLVEGAELTIDGYRNHGWRSFTETRKLMMALKWHSNVLCRFFRPGPVASFPAP